MIKTGKYKGRSISSMTSIEETQFLNWFYNSKFASNNQRILIKKHLGIK